MGVQLLRFMIKAAALKVQAQDFRSAGRFGFFGWI
jgi:hypothetical protein